MGIGDDISLTIDVNLCVGFQYIIDLNKINQIHAVFLYYNLQLFGFWFHMQ